jgi:5,10-methylenetetrahydromethanopterin reductase
MLRLAIVGTPDECIEKISEIVADGITHVSLGGPLGPDPREAIRLIGDVIIPACRVTGRRSGSPARASELVDGQS